MTPMPRHCADTWSAGMGPSGGNLRIRQEHLKARGAFPAGDPPGSPPEDPFEDSFGNSTPDPRKPSSNKPQKLWVTRLLLRLGSQPVEAPACAYFRMPLLWDDSIWPLTLIESTKPHRK